MWSVIRTETAEFEQRKDGRKIIMTFSMKRALAIFKKDYKDLSRNLFVSSTLIIRRLLFTARRRRHRCDVLRHQYHVQPRRDVRPVRLDRRRERKEHAPWSDAVAGEHARHPARKECAHVRDHAHPYRGVCLYHGIQSCEPTHHFTRTHRHAGVFLLLVLTDVVGVRGPILYHWSPRVLDEYCLDQSRASNRGRCWTSYYMGGTCDSFCLGTCDVLWKYCDV